MSLNQCVRYKTYSAKRGLHSVRRALYYIKRAPHKIYPAKRALYSVKRALHPNKRAPLSVKRVCLCSPTWHLTRIRNTQCPRTKRNVSGTTRSCVWHGSERMRTSHEPKEKIHKSESGMNHSCVCDSVEELRLRKVHEKQKKVWVTELRRACVTWRTHGGLPSLNTQKSSVTFMTSSCVCDMTHS